jgi:hypothetical protein
VNRQHQLLEVVLTRHALGRLSNAPHGRQEQPDEDGQDAEDDEELGEGERVAR